MKNVVNNFVEVVQYQECNIARENLVKSKKFLIFLGVIVFLPTIISSNSSLTQNCTKLAIKFFSILNLKKELTKRNSELLVTQMQ